MTGMPILVQWKWQERGKHFLVIFYFYDDFSKSNLRFKMERVVNSNIITTERGIDYKSTVKELVHPSVLNDFDINFPPNQL